MKYNQIFPDFITNSEKRSTTAAFLDVLMHYIHHEQQEETVKRAVENWSYILVGMVGTTEGNAADPYTDSAGILIIDGQSTSGWASDIDRKNRVPGIGFDYGFDATGSWDEADMAPEGVPPFEPGDYYIVGWTESDATYPVQLYSRDEMIGWLRYSVHRYSKHHPHHANAIEKIEHHFYNPNTYQDLIPKKLAGDLRWDCNYPNLTNP